MNYTLKKQLLGMQSHLLNFAFKLTGNPDTAADLLQETSLKVLDSEEKFTSDVNFKGWVFTIMRHIFINNFRKNSRISNVIDSSEDLSSLSIPVIATDNTPEGSVALHEIMDVLRSFTDDFRLPFTLMIQGYRYSEISDRLNLPVGTVKSRIHLARMRLRDALSDYHD